MHFLVDAIISFFFTAEKKSPSHFLYPFFYGWTAGLVPQLSYMNSVVINSMQVSLCTLTLCVFFGYIHRNSTGESHSKSTFVFLKYLHTNFHYGWNCLNQLYKIAHLSIFSPTFGNVLLMTAFLIGVRYKYGVILIGIPEE